MIFHDLTQLFDPQRGVKGKKYYISHEEDGGPIDGESYLIKGYSEVIEIKGASNEEESNPCQ